MKCTSILYSAVAVALIGLSSPASAEEKAASYVLLKGGLYSPSTSYHVDNFNGGSTSHLDSKTGFAGEVAVGHYFLPTLAVELGAGYFESKGSPAAEPGKLKLKVFPVIATAKVLFPIGSIEPYGLFGIGAYFTDVDVDGNLGELRGTTKITYGLHAGAGINFNITDTVFLGAEGKYLWARPSFGGTDLELDGFVTTANIGFRF